MADTSKRISASYGVLVTDENDEMYGAALRGLFIIGNASSYTISLHSSPFENTSHVYQIRRGLFVVCRSMTMQSVDQWRKLCDCLRRSNGRMHISVKPVLLLGSLARTQLRPILTNQRSTSRLTTLPRSSSIIPAFEIETIRVPNGNLIRFHNTRQTIY